MGESGVVVTSPDALDWVMQTSGTGRNLIGITYGSGQFVAVGDQGTVVTSPDAVAWTRSSQAGGARLAAVAYGTNRFVAVGDSGAILFSSDGKIWTPSASGSNEPLRGVAWGHGLFVAVGRNQTIVTSPDAVTWTARPTRGLPAWTESYIRGVIVTEEGFMAVGGDTADYAWVFASADGQEWQAIMLSTQTIFSSVAEGAGRFVAAGTSGNVLTSTNGTSWTSVSTVVTREVLTAVAAGPNQAVAIGAGIFTSTNGVQWTERPFARRVPLRGACYGGDQFVAVGFNNLIVLSSDGITWTPVTSGWDSSRHLYGVAYGNGRYVAVGLEWPGPNSIVSAITSRDGVHWTNQFQSLPTQRELRGVCWGGDQFVAVGTKGSIWSSPDGVTWTARDSRTGLDLQGVTWGQDQFVAVGQEILTSPNGTNWTVRATSLDSFSGVAYDGRQFAAVGAGGKIYTSSDGAHWTRHTTGASQPLTGICAFDERFLVVGWDGAILQSALVPTVPAVLGPIFTQEGGAIGIGLSGVAGTVYTIQGTSDFHEWSTLTNYLLPSSTGVVHDLSATNSPQGFFRAVVP